MKGKTLHNFIFPVIFSLLFAISVTSASAQSQALNGQIEGTVLDQNNAAVPNAIITVTNLQTGATRTLTTNESGVYRFPLLPLGTFRISAEAPNYKKIVREGIILTTGQTATVDFSLPAGELSELVTVSADAPIADAGKTDVGRVMNTREVQNLPLVSRNPYNFALLQANVTGRPSRGFNFPTVNANGYSRRIYYQLDGNTATQSDRAGVRLMNISDTYVSEVQLVMNGFAAEFGNTPGLIMNVVTPSGTNELSGSVGYRFRRPSFYSRPFFYSSAELLPDNSADNIAAMIGAPIARDWWHVFSGFEYIKRDDNTRANRLSKITEVNKAQLIAAGLPASIFPPSIPSLESGSFYILRSDAQLNETNHLTVRFNYSALLTKNNIQGNLNTLERSSDTASVDHSVGVQLISFTSNVLNEFRFQFVRRKVAGMRNTLSGTGPSIVITNVANFGSPEGADTITPLEKVSQIQDNLTRTHGAHAIKFGGGFNFIGDLQRSAIFARYTFPSITAYVAARNRTAPFAYERFEESFGDPEAKYNSTFLNFFVQDDWKFTRRFKFNYGLRYDLYKVPKADPSSPFPASQRFNVDKNNLAPRLGLVYALREGARPIVLRVGAGLYYEAPWLNMYQRALLNNGNPRFFNFAFFRSSSGAPAFPNTFSGSMPPLSALLQQDIDAIAPDFENMYAIHTNIQLEQALTENLSIAVGYVHSAGRHIPVYRNINPINPTTFLADGRGVFSTTVNSSTRLDPRFNIIQMVEAAGVAKYDAVTLQMTHRLVRGLQFSANYTLSKATDDAPEQNLATVQPTVLSDPNNRRLDRGNSFADQRHTFVMSLVAGPKFNFPNKTLHYLFNNNQFGIIATANSGERFNIVSNLDLNRDGIFGAGITNSDRPVGIKRNSGKTPPQYNVDMRYSRFFNFTERYKLEAFSEFQNLLNINSIVQFTNVTVTTNPLTGELTGPLPDFRARNQSTAQESRQFQLGVKFIF